MKMTAGIVTDIKPVSKQAFIEKSSKGDRAVHDLVVASVLPLFEKNGNVGLAVAAIADERQDITGFGSTAINSGIVPDGNTVFEIGSITKLFTASILASCIEKGNLSPDTRVYDMLHLSDAPDSIKIGARKKEITLRNLVTHTSGLPRMSPDIFRPSQIWAGISGGNPYAMYSRDLMKNIFINFRMKGLPGEKLKYSNIGYGLLGTLLCDYSGMNYAQLVNEKINIPLKMKDTFLNIDKERSLRFAEGCRGYFRYGKFYLAQKSDPWDFSEGMAGAGGLRSTAHDMLVFMQANMDEKILKNRHFLKETHKILYEKDKIAIGMGWFYDRLPVSQHEIIYHDGISGGYAGFIGITSDYRFGVVILGNTSKPVNSIGYAVLDKFVANFSK